MLPPLWFRLSAGVRLRSTVSAVRPDAIGPTAETTTAALPADTWRLATRDVRPERVGERADGTGDAERRQAVTGILAIVG